MANKKVLIVVFVVVIAGLAYFGYQKGFFNGGTIDKGTIDGGIPGDGENIETRTPQGEGQEKGQKDPYASAQGITAPTGLASELKSIFSEVCGGVKLITVYNDFSGPGTDLFIYVWKNKPTEEKLINAFVKNGYEHEPGVSGGMFDVKKGSLALTVDWTSEEYQQEIGVQTYQGE